MKGRWYAALGPGALVLFFTLALGLRPVSAQEAVTYRQPPAPIPAILDARPTPAVEVSPDHQWLLLIERPALPPIAELAAPELRLAGTRIDPRTNGPARQLFPEGMRLRSIDGDTERRIELPAGARVGAVTWNPSSTRLAFTLSTDDRITLWVAEVQTGAARRLTDRPLNAAAGMPYRWITPDRLLCRFVPAGRGAPPPAPAAPSGPVVQESAGKARPNRTYQDLLQGPHDERLFEHYFTCQLARVGLDGSVEELGAPGLHVEADPSPDGTHLLVETLARPFSYVVPMNRFPHRVEVWGADGKLVRRVAEVPLQEGVPAAFDAVPAGVRSARWRADAPAELWWVEALDGGDPAAQVSHRDRVVALAAPFDGPPRTVIDLAHRLSGVTWSDDRLALVSERWWKTRRTRTWVVDPAPADSAAPRVLFDRSSEDRYGDPGSFVTARGPFGRNVLQRANAGQLAYLTGAGASPEGDLPFLDRIDLATGRTERLWRAQAPHLERCVALLGSEGQRFVSRRESVDEPPNYHLVDLAEGTRRALTAFEDPAPQFEGIEPQLLTYARADGVQLSAKLFLPPGYDPSHGPLPFLFWVYPQEFKSSAAAAQVRGSSHQFVRPAGASHLFLLTQGYGILDGPTMPVVGEGEREPNDTYVAQLVDGARAAIDTLVAMGVADRARIAIGGHSYGAFTTANLLAHTDLFRAGIARSGAFNRTLTPFGFQAEERIYWQARDTYHGMSPFTFADKINEPLLLIHGADDNNPGTFPVQSERLYGAISGLGGTVRLVMLPSESHGYRARESVGHTLYEMVAWLDAHLGRAGLTGARHRERF